MGGCGLCRVENHNLIQGLPVENSCGGEAQENESRRNVPGVFRDAGRGISRECGHILLKPVAKFELPRFPNQIQCRDD